LIGFNVLDEEDSISNFETFQSSLNAKADLGKDWIFVSKIDCVLFIYIDSACCPVITASIKVLKDIVVQTFDNKQQLDSNELAWLLGDENKLVRWSQLPNIYSHLNNTCQVKPVSPTVDDHVNVINCRMKELIHASKNTENTKLEFRLKYLLKQLELLYSLQKWYSPKCMLHAFKILCTSRSVYSYLRESCLTLPHPSYLRQLTSCFSQCCQTLTDDDTHFVYLRQKCNALAEHERLSILLLDKIYLNRE
jgi:hypothetical protein